MHEIARLFTLLRQQINRPISITIEMQDADFPLIYVRISTRLRVKKEPKKFEYNKAFSIKASYEMNLSVESVAEMISQEVNYAVDSYKEEAEHAA